MKQLLIFLSLSIFLLGCKKEDYAKIDEQIIQKYIADNQLTATATGSGLYYITTLEGTGINPVLASKVTVNYKGYLTNGTVFDRTSGTLLSFFLSQVIKGWQEGIPLIKKGGKATLLIPSALGYGSQSVGTIPANSVTIFEVELVNVQ